MKLKSFQQFLAENSSFNMAITKRVNCFSDGNWFIKDPTTGVDEVYNICKRDLFNMVEQNECIKGTAVIDMTLPAYGIAPKFTEWLLKEKKYDPALVYNIPEESYHKIRKINLYKQLNKMGSKYTSKTIFSIDDIDKLKFPIVAKFQDSWQSKGVEKFDTLEDLSANENYKRFDIYQEAFSIDKEYRAIVFKGKADDTVPKILLVSLREPNNEKSRSLRVSESAGADVKNEITGNQSSKFRWTAVDIYNDNEDRPDLKELSNIIKEVFKICPKMNVIGIDFAVDKDGRYWLIEANAGPGQNGITSHLICLNIFKDYYKLDFPKTDIDKMKTSMYSSIQMTAKGIIGYRSADALLDPKCWYGISVDEA